MTTQIRLNILEIIKEFSPGTTWRVNQRSQRGRYTMKCPIHQGDDENFTVDENEQLYHCFSNCGGGNAYQLRQLLSGVTSPPPRTARPPKPPRSSDEAVFEGASVEDLATNKGLDITYLKEELGWRDTIYKSTGTPCIRISYFDTDKMDPLTRFRVGISGDRFRWLGFRGKKMRPYGLWKLEEARRKGYIALVEGETDFCSLDFNGICCLGIPGAQAWSPVWANYLAGISEVFVWKEPGDAGDAFVTKIRKSRPDMLVLEAPPGVKDPCEMAQQAGDGFKEWFLEMMADARIEGPTSIEEPEGWAVFTPDDESNATGTGTYTHSRGDSKLLRKKTVHGYLMMGDPDSATRVNNCTLWKRIHDYDCGLSVGNPFHCFKKGCPNCTAARLSMFFYTKMAILEKELTRPMVMVFDVVGTLPLAGDLEADQELLSRGYKGMRNLLSKMTDTIGGKLQLAKDHMYGLLGECKEGSVTFGFALLGNEEEGDLAAIENYLSEKMGAPVNGRRYTGTLPKMVSLFAVINQEGFKWETPEQFAAWVRSQKGKKSIQAKGAFYGVSGSKAAGGPGDEITIAECPQHGVDEVVTRTSLIAGPDCFFDWVSPHTGKVVSVLERERRIDARSVTEKFRREDCLEEYG